MKNFLKKLGVISIATFVIALSFFAGLYVDASKTTLSAGLSGLTSSTSHKNIDISAFWKAWDILQDKYIVTATTTTDKDKVYGAIKGLAESMGDPYTTFFNVEETKSFHTDLSGTLEGIGAVLNVKDGILSVVSIIKNSPAERKGLKEGDKITKINDVDTLGIDINKAVSLIRGKKDTSVTLSLIRDGRNMSLSIKRDTITTPVIETVKNKTKNTFTIKITSFTSNSPELFRTALKEYEDSRLDNLIIDLRNNTGGYLDASVDIASWFIPTGKTIVIEDFGGKKDQKIYRSKGYNMLDTKKKIVILVNENSASASEIMAGALKDYDKAILVGTKTYGKGSVQELIPVTNDTVLKVTIAKWLTPKGTSISNNGIIPDYVVDLTEDDYKNKRDPQLDKALEVVRKL
jgi:carboxyl-terminal processing protease